MEAKTDNGVSEELLCALNHLRWILTGYKLGGIECWAVKRAAGTCEAGEPCEALDVRDPGDVRDSRDVCDPRGICGPGEPGPKSEPRGPEGAYGLYGIAGRDEPGLGPDSSSRLASIHEELGECRRCRLSSERTRIVFGEGAPRSDLVFVGEGPGFDEDRQGRPFVGRAGKLLNAMIRALGMDREEVYICNVVKCRPPGNRTPNPDEIEVCSRFLFQQLAAIQPRVICALGGCAAQTLLGSTAAISRLRGKAHQWRGTPLICTYHPAYLLRTPAQKVSTWQDLLLVRRLLETGRPPT